MSLNTEKMIQLVWVVVLLNRQYIDHQGKKVPMILGAKGGCFPAETLISMWDGTDKIIKDITVGDMVKAFTKTS